MYTKGYEELKYLLSNEIFKYLFRKATSLCNNDRMMIIAEIDGFLFSMFIVLLCLESHFRCRFYFCPTVAHFLDVTIHSLRIRPPLLIFELQINFEIFNQLIIGVYNKIDIFNCQNRKLTELPIAHDRKIQGIEYLKGRNETKLF